jgi:hypothetical protein
MNHLPQIKPEGSFEDDQVDAYLISLINSFILIPLSSTTLTYGKEFISKKPRFVKNLEQLITVNKIVCNKLDNIAGSINK